MGTPLPKANVKCPVVVAKSNIALVLGRDRFTGLNLDRFDECRIMLHCFSSHFARPSVDLRQPCPSRPILLILTGTSFRCRPIPETLHFGRWATLRVASQGSSFAASCRRLVERGTQQIKSIYIISSHLLLKKPFLVVSWLFLGFRAPQGRDVRLRAYLCDRAQLTAAARNTSPSQSEFLHDQRKSRPSIM